MGWEDALAGRGVGNLIWRLREGWWDGVCIE